VKLPSDAQRRVAILGQRGKRYAVPLLRFREHQMRSSKQWRELVITQIRNGIDPLRQDVAEALRQPAPRRRLRITAQVNGDLSAAMEDYAGTPEEASDTALLLEYVVKTYIAETRPQRPGPKTAPRTLEEELRIANAYLAAKAELLDAKGGTEEVRDVEEAARRKAAALTGRNISTKTVKRIIDGLRARTNWTK
jgi:hypothetical protein